MNYAIISELAFFLVSVLWGSILLLTYDVLRIIRRLIKHGALILAFEDLIFWIAASIFIYSMIYRQNNGIIRGFSMAGMAIGMVLYHYLMDDYLVNLIVKVIRFLLRPLSLAIKVVKKGILFITAKVKKIGKLLLGQLKKIIKSVKIAVSKKRQAAAEKRRVRLEQKAARRMKKGKSRRKGNGEQPQAVIRKAPRQTFERVDPEKFRYGTGGLQKDAATTQLGYARKAGASHRNKKR